MDSSKFYENNDEIFNGYIETMNHKRCEGSNKICNSFIELNRCKSTYDTQENIFIYEIRLRLISYKIFKRKYSLVLQSLNNMEALI